MTAIEHIKAAQKAKLIDEDREPVTIELAPALTGAEIDDLEVHAEQHLPEELRTLLSFLLWY